MTDENFEAPTPPEPQLAVSNPIQAASEIFYKPKEVFDALAVKDNWSWIPFILIIVVSFFPGFLYFGVVDFDWWREITITSSMPDASPAEIKNMEAFYMQGPTKWGTAITFVIAPILINLVFALYYTLVTRNDEKSIQGYTDWYGATWWMSMPMVINALLALILISLQSTGAQISMAILSPLSLAFVLGTEMTSPWLNFLSGVRLDYLWAIYLAMTCLRSWTNFSVKKALIVALIPTALIWSVTAIFAAT